MTRLRTVALALVLVLAVPVTAAADNSATRLFLLASEGGDGYWSVDPTDPELPALAASRTCGVTTAVRTDGVCHSSISIGDDTHEHLVPFAPAALVDDTGGHHTEPLRFRFALEVGSPAAFTVHAVIDNDLYRNVSDAATEVSPGVWEGTMAFPTPLAGTVNQLGVLIRTSAPTISVSVATGGESWFHLSRPVVARGVPALRSADSGGVVSSYTGAGRTLHFTDEDWSATSFTGDLSQDRSFTFPVARPARMLIAWVETFESPLVYDVASQREPDPRRLENSPFLQVSYGDGESVEGTNSGIRGRGQDAVAALDVPAGDIVASVTPSSWDPDGGGQDHPYTVHIVAVHGERTLRSMRWRFAMGVNLSLPGVSVCPYGNEPVPVPRNVTTFAVDVDWRTYSLPLPEWTVSYELPSVGFYPCGESNEDDRVRFTVPPSDRVWMVGPAPSRRGRYAATDDTVFEMQVDYTYAGV